MTSEVLSKQNLAPALPTADAAVRPLLHRALIALDQAPPAELATAPVDEQLNAAIAAWDSRRLCAQRYRPQPPGTD